MPKRRDAKKARSRQKIIDGTVACIAAYGLAGVTISRICEATHLSRGMVNAHFDNKDNLLLEVLKSIAEDYQLAVEEAVTATGGNPADALRAEIETETAFWMRSHTESCVWFAFRAASLSDPDYLAICGPREASLYAIPRQLCAALADGGSYPGVDSERVAHGLTAMLEGFWFDWVSYPDDFDLEGARASCLDYLQGQFPRHF